MPSNIRKVAEEAARTVGARMRQTLEKQPAIEVREKALNDLVTEVDIWAEGVVKSAAAEAFPRHLVIGEESAAELEKERGASIAELASRGICWIVDPIDGTTNFVNGIPHCCVAIGVMEDGCRVFGLVYDPFRDELFTAEKGKGASLNERPIHVSNKTELIDAVACTGFTRQMRSRDEAEVRRYEEFLFACRKIRTLGSAALELSWLAAGRLDALFMKSLKPWDIAAGSLIVEEAGGRIGSFENPECGESAPFEATTVGANPKLFEKMLALEKSRRS